MTLYIKVDSFFFECFDFSYLLVCLVFDRVGASRRKSGARGD